MKRLSSPVALIVSGAFLMVGTAVADPDRKHEQGSRDCFNNSRYCSSLGQHADRRDRHDRDDRREPRYTDNRHSQYDQYDDSPRRPDVDIRISTYPVYINTDRNPRYYRPAPPRVVRYDYRPYNYREYVVPTYPQQSLGYEPGYTRVIRDDAWPQEQYAPQQTSNGPVEQHCREYYTEADVQGRTQQIYGTACLQEDGSWKIIN